VNSRRTPRTIPLTLGIVRAFNNNVVVARDDAGRDYVLMGKGIGFRASAHDRISTSSTELATAEAVARLASDELGLDLADSLVIALADHLAQALRNKDAGVQASAPLAREVIYAFPSEYAVAEKALDVVFDHSGVRLPASEAAAITLHLVNASYAAGDMTTTFQLTSVLTEVISIVERDFDVPVDTSSPAAARFATHLRFLLNRLQNKTQQEGTSSYMWSAARASHPREHACAVIISALLGDRFGVVITQDEELYLTLHVMRLLARTDPA
jgi:beta-glucoside operon transcriptional antiterminator